MNDWLVFNTSKGKDLQGLVEGGASFGTSIRGWGQYNEDTKEIENYDFLGCDAVGNPSAGTFASKEQFTVTVELVEPRQAARIQEQLEDTMPKQYDISEKIGAFREKHLNDGVPSKITREMTTDLLTMRRECVEAGHDTQELDALSNEIFGEQTEPRAPPSPKSPAQNSNQDRDLLNRAQRELEATKNLAVHLKDQVTELETSLSTTERQLSGYRRVAEFLQKKKNAVMREADETQSFQAARLVRKAVSRWTTSQQPSTRLVSQKSSALLPYWKT